ncbi:phosphoribosylformimino-5-aminoimidazole carboxamide ribotide isomerase [Desulfosalsimonas propionicica]|uniref:1-(5-phosphoribosyl)-5-[(5-phosphoribosylamino)methylideneamino] imidazole-4-carboxamide isomerase n=1 Tax=Desulfosalsimonas propionicica TaxID=332175 RepID=A0A7W0CAY8_9BACT|nr:1-(5-phosphoribosyl)-5-[(5-phosphoribosylamino)methylideneamino]imidazole-4-carboxamide isomerase [Desulfosalsimonas propionicica]MBA2882419.1 phosphoribosylformimino-5-aminoimidazole carboxamide ribotide isomerase [Desulfosalsimonas propionicica]
MIVIPAIDIKGGRCVRLLQGRMDQETVFSDDPPAMAVRWIDQGARLIHVVDLDGAIEKSPKNLAAIEQITSAAGSVPIQVGGGIRDLDTIGMYLDQGVDRVVIGSAAIYDPDLVRQACRDFPGRIVVGIDARNGKVAIEGWTQTTEVSAIELGRQFEDSGVAAINFTDIERDGMQTGPNIEAIREFARAVGIPVVASGGVSCMDDIRNLSKLAEDGVSGIITGRALYDGRLDLREAAAFLDAL